MERDFKGVWIPKEIWLNSDLTMLEKVIYVEIDSLDNDNHCTASNDYFAGFCDCSTSKITKAISKLQSLGMIEVLDFDGRHRKIRVVKSTRQSSKKYEAESQKVRPINSNSNLEKHSKSKDLECNAPSTSDFNFGKTKEHKPSLYSKCQAHIQAFSTNAGVQSRLKAFLDSLTDMQKLRGERQFVGILNKLKELSADPKTQCKIIDYTIEKGYATFYDSALNSTTAHRACASDLGKHSDALTAKEKAEVRKAQQDGTAEKF